MVRVSDDEDEVLIGKKKKKDNSEKKTYVFDIELTAYTNENYAEYNWKKLVQKEEDKDRDSDIEIIEIDINDSKPKNKKVKPVDPEDEYDLEDDFIDDSEINDEEVPDEVSTACGGFYINTGSLKFKYKEDKFKKPLDKNLPQHGKDRGGLSVCSKPQQGGLPIKSSITSSNIPVPVANSVPGKRSNGVGH